MITKAVLCAFCATMLTTTIASAEPFTYQGALSDASAPANGTYDFRFTLHSAQSGGSQIGSTVVLGDVPVTNGVFSVDLDFGDDLFQTTTRWLEIRLRDGDSTGSYTTLTPRTAINPAPVAQHATTATALTNPIWNQSGSVITAGTGLNRVFINRDTSISGSEYFGVHAEATGFVGMYISGPTGSFPFYGYSVNGNISAYSYFNSSDDSLNFVGAGLVTAMRITSDNNVEVARDIQAESFQYETPKLSYCAISGDAFHSASGDPFQASSGTGGAFMTVATSGWLTAPVTLPHGATVIRMRAYFNDNVPGDMTINLNTRSHGGSIAQAVASISTTGFSGSSLQATTTTIVNPIINNNTTHYHIRVFSSGWPGNSSLAIKSVVIEYTTAEAD